MVKKASENYSIDGINSNYNILWYFFYTFSTKKFNYTKGNWEWDKTHFHSLRNKRIVFFVPGNCLPIKAVSTESVDSHPHPTQIFDRTIEFYYEFGKLIKLNGIFSENKILSPTKCTPFVSYKAGREPTPYWW